MQLKSSVADEQQYLKSVWYGIPARLNLNKIFFKILPDSYMYFWVHRDHSRYVHLNLWHHDSKPIHEECRGIDQS